MRFTRQPGVRRSVVMVEKKLDADVATRSQTGGHSVSLMATWVVSLRLRLDMDKPCKHSGTMRRLAATDDRRLFVDLSSSSSKAAIHQAASFSGVLQPSSA